MSKVLLINPGGKTAKKRKHKTKSKGKKLLAKIKKKKLLKHKKKAMTKPRPNPKLKIKVKAKKVHRIIKKGDTTMAKKKKGRKNPYVMKTAVYRGEKPAGKMKRRNPDGLGLGLMGLRRPSFGLMRPNLANPGKKKGKKKKNPGFLANPGNAIARSMVHPFQLATLGTVGGIGTGVITTWVFPSAIMDLIWKGRPGILQAVEPAIGGVILGSGAKLLTKSDSFGRGIMLGGFATTVVKGVLMVVASAIKRATAEKPANPVVTAYAKGMAPALGGLGQVDEEAIKAQIEEEVTKELEGVDEAPEAAELGQPQAEELGQAPEAEELGQVPGAEESEGQGEELTGDTM